MRITEMREMPGGGTEYTVHIGAHRVRVVVTPSGYTTADVAGVGGRRWMRLTGQAKAHVAHIRAAKEMES